MQTAYRNRNLRGIANKLPDGTHFTYIKVIINAVVYNYKNSTHKDYVTLFLQKSEEEKVIQCNVVNKVVANMTTGSYYILYIFR